VSDSHVSSEDFKVVSNKIKFAIKCVDSNIKFFKSSEKVIEDLVVCNCAFKQGTRLIVILGANFLLVPLDELQRRGIFVCTVNEMDSLTQLAVIEQSNSER
jgi:hypothetical protein